MWSLGHSGWIAELWDERLLASDQPRMTGIDSYVFRARVIPVVIVILPPLVLPGAGVISGARLGIATGLVTLVVALVLLLAEDPSLAQRVGRFGPGGGVAVAALVFWCFVVTDDWVRVPAEAYADRLIEAIDDV